MWTWLSMKRSAEEERGGAKRAARDRPGDERFETQPESGYA